MITSGRSVAWTISATTCEPASSTYNLTRALVSKKYAARLAPIGHNHLRQRESLHLNTPPRRSLGVPFTRPLVDLLDQCVLAVRTNCSHRMIRIVGVFRLAEGQHPAVS